MPPIRRAISPGQASRTYSERFSQASNALEPPQCGTHQSSNTGASRPHCVGNRRWHRYGHRSNDRPSARTERLTPEGLAIKPKPHQEWETLVTLDHFRKELWNLCNLWVLSDKQGNQDVVASLPPSSGVYCCIDNDDRFSYIGKANNIYYRFQAGHHRIEDILVNGLKEIRWIGLETHETAFFESVLIQELNPYLNQRRESHSFNSTSKRLVQEHFSDRAKKSIGGIDPYPLVLKKQNRDSIKSRAERGVFGSAAQAEVPGSCLNPSFEGCAMPCPRLNLFSKTLSPAQSGRCNEQNHPRFHHRGVDRNSF